MDRPSRSGEYLQSPYIKTKGYANVVVHQSTQTVLTRVPETTSAEFEQAVDAASQAYKTWSRTSVITRQRFAIE